MICIVSLRAYTLITVYHIFYGYLECIMHVSYTIVIFVVILVAVTVYVHVVYACFQTGIVSQCVQVTLCNRLKEQH